MTTTAPQTPPSFVERQELGEHTTAPWKVRALAECPQKFHRAAVLKDPRRKDGGFDARVGTLLHHGIEQAAWFRTWLSLGREPLSPDEFLRAMDQTTKNRSIEAARKDPEALAEARAIAKRIARNVDLVGMVVESIGTKLRPLVEEPWTLDVGEVDGERVVVGGIWDLVRRKNGRIVITDWKKGGNVRSSDELRIDAAATLYAAAAHARWPKEDVRVEHFYLTKGFATGLDWSPEVDEWARAAALDYARAVRAFAKANEWPATPSVHACSFCSFRSTCPAFLERVRDGFGLAAFDLTKKDDIETAVRARAKAHEDEKLAAKFVEDLDALLAPLLAQAAEHGLEELVIAGHKIARRKRATPRFDDWRFTLTRLWELTGVPVEELEEKLLVLAKGRIEELLTERGFAAEDKERILDAVEKTGSEHVASWIEVRPVADPTPTVDVERILATGIRVVAHKNEPVPPHGASVAAPSSPGEAVSPNPVPAASPAPAPSTENTPRAQEAGPGPQAAPATPKATPTDEGATRATTPATPPPVDPAPVAEPERSEGGACAAPTEERPTTALEEEKFGRVLTADERVALLARELPLRWVLAQNDGPCVTCGNRARTVDPDGKWRHFPGCLGATPLPGSGLGCALCGQALLLVAHAALKDGRTACASCFVKTGEPWPTTIVPAEEPKASVGFNAASLAHACPSCGRGFQNARGLAGHRRSCGKAKT